MHLVRKLGIEPLRSSARKLDLEKQAQQTTLNISIPLYMYIKIPPICLLDIVVDTLGDLGVRIIIQGIKITDRFK